VWILNDSDGTEEGLISLRLGSVGDPLSPILSADSLRIHLDGKPIHPIRPLLRIWIDGVKCCSEQVA